MSDRVKFADIHICDNGICENDRSVYDRTKMAQTKESIRKTGLLQPMICRYKNNRLELVAGERRHRCISSLIAENAQCFDHHTKTLLPAREVYDTIEIKLIDCDDIEAKAVQLQENLDRENFSEMDLIHAVVRLENTVNDKKEKLLTRKQISQMTHKSESWISQSLSIYEMPECVHVALQDGTLGRTAAIQLLQTDHDKIPEVLAAAKKRIESAFRDEIAAYENKIKEIYEQVNEDQKSFEEKEGDESASISEINKAEAKVEESVKLLEGFSEKLKKFKKSAYNKTTLTAEAVSAANADLGASNGAPKAVTQKTIRKFGESLTKALSEGSTSTVVVDGKKCKRRDVEILQGMTDWALGKRKGNPLDIL